MRLSTNVLSPFYEPAKVGRAKVYLDGQLIRRCWEASEEEGWADVWVERDGKIVRNDAGDGALSERLFGRVEIVLPPEG